MQVDGLLLGFDIGSSSVKGAVLDPANGHIIASATSPQTELPIDAPHPGWAQQHPDLWWEHVVAVSSQLAQQCDTTSVRAIGISYQMHGLILVDKANRPLRPAIIWCDSRAVATGEQVYERLGRERILARLLNSPANFTASRLCWVRNHEPHLYRKAAAFMLPGDYIALRMTGRRSTTICGLSEAILWDFIANDLSEGVLEACGIDRSLVPPLCETFGEQGELTREAAAELKLTPGTTVTYRGGDQPNNALSLQVLEPGDVAATAGTSGVVFGVVDTPRYDPLSRVNTFAHVNYTPRAPRCGVLLCINGAGILNSWLRQLLGTAAAVDYTTLNQIAQRAPAGCDGLVVLPFGNGAERSLQNRECGAAFSGIDLTRHTAAHLLRASQEGIVFAFNHGLDIMRGMGVGIERIRAGHANMFLSPLFRSTFATVTGATVELYNTDGAAGAARGAGIGCGWFTFSTAFDGLNVIERVEPDPLLAPALEGAREKWLRELERNQAQHTTKAPQHGYHLLSDGDSQ